MTWRTAVRRGGGVVVAVLVLASCSSGSRIEHAVTACNTDDSPYVRLVDGGRGVTIAGAPVPGSPGAPLATVQCILKVLEVSAPVLAGIEDAAGTGGTGAGDWAGLHATWTDTPVRGMQITIVDGG